MNREIIREAATVEAAVELAAAELGVPAGQLTVTVLQEPQKKVLGLFGGTLAKIRAVYTEPEKKASAAETAREFLEKLLAEMGAKNLKVRILSENDDGCQLAIDGDDVGFVIGRRGDTLDALQYLTGLIANRVDNSYYRVTINVGNYREKREQSLTGLARRNAAQAAKTGRKYSLEPMNPYERRIIHTAVQEIEGATSWSVGKEPNRHVIIGPSEDNPVRNTRRENKQGDRSKPQRSRRGGDRPQRPERPSRDKAAERTSRPKLNDNDVYERYAAGLADKPIRQFVSRSNPLPVADGVTPPPDKTPSEVENSDIKLYGRIDNLIVPERRTLKDVGWDEDDTEE